MSFFSGLSSNDRVPKMWEMAKRHNDSVKFAIPDDGIPGEITFTPKGQAVRHRAAKNYEPVMLG